MIGCLQIKIYRITILLKISNLTLLFWVCQDYALGVLFMGVVWNVLRVNVGYQRLIYYNVIYIYIYIFYYIQIITRENIPSRIKLKTHKYFDALSNINILYSNMRCHSRTIILNNMFTFDFCKKFKTTDGTTLTRSFNFTSHRE